VQLLNNIGDEFLNDCLVTLIESDMFDRVKNGKMQITIIILS